LAVFLLLISLFAVLAFNNAQKPFYVGVTFCGDTASDAKLLIDKVKNYTNLFVLQSGALQRDANAMNEIGDYATSSGLNFLVYFGVDEAYQTDAWLEWFEAAKERWGSMFLGIYYGDEPAGKMLDTYIPLSEYGDDEQVTKLGTGGLSVYYSNGTSRIYWADGTVQVRVPDKSGDPDSQNGTLFLTYQNETVTIDNVPKPPEENLGHFTNGTYVHWIPIQKAVETTYYPNGTITIMKTPERTLYTAENGSELISQAEPYREVLEKSPIKNCDEAAQTFVSRTSSTLEWLSNQSATILTSDYALHWWDYLSGYDTVLAQLGWNNTVAQEIGLVRGAANLQGKSWGTILTWKYTTPPYLASGEEIYDQMRMAYECGSEYVVLFNHADDMQGPYGTMKDEHFQALERFWNDVVQNQSVAHGSVKADSVLVLPHNYGWGMRSPGDNIWGLWRPDTKSQQVWTQLQNALSKHGLRLDIVYDDPAYPVTGKYSQIYYWNQTG
jgi:hypothetical protein